MNDDRRKLITMNNTPIYKPQGSLLSCMQQDEREQLLALAEQRHYTKGDFIFRVGSPAQHVYLLTDGRVKIFELSSLGREVILWFCFSGEMFGMAETPRGGPRQVFAQACSDTSALVVKREDFTDFLIQRPTVALLVIEMLSCRMRGLGDMLLNLSSEDVATRLIKLLTRLSVVYGVPAGAEVKLSIALTHQELADMIGTSRQTVTGILGDLRRQGLLRIEDHCIVVRRGAILDSDAPVSSTGVR